LHLPHPCLYADTAVKLVAIFLVALLLSVPAVRAQDISTPAGAVSVSHLKAGRSGSILRRGFIIILAPAGTATLSRENSWVRQTLAPKGIDQLRTGS